MHRVWTSICKRRRLFELAGLLAVGLLVFGAAGVVQAAVDIVVTDSTNSYFVGSGSNVAVDSLTQSGGGVSLGNGIAGNPGGVLTVNGALTQSGGELRVNGGSTLNAGSLIQSGGVLTVSQEDIVANGTLTVTGAVAQSGGVIAVYKGDSSIGSLNQTGGIFLVGFLHDEVAGTPTTSAKLTVTGGSVTSSGGWIGLLYGSTLTADVNLNGPNAALNVFGDQNSIGEQNTIVGNLIVTQGTVRIDTPSTLTVYENQGTAHIGSPQAAGRLNVTGNADFQAGSTLSLYAASKALTVNNLTVADGAKLVITGGAVGELSDMIDITGVLNASADAWTGSNLSTSTPLLKAAAVWNGKQYVLTLSPGSTQDVYPISDGVGALADNALQAAGGTDASAGAKGKGVLFTFRAFSPENGKPGIGTKNAKLAATTFEGAGELAQVGAVPGLTLGAANAGAGAAAGRTSHVPNNWGGKGGVALHQDTDGTVGMSAGNEFKRNGLGVWIMPLYQNNQVWGMKAGNFKTGYSSSLGGIALGADYTFQEMFRIGASFNVGGGYAKSTGDFNSSESHSSFWGLNLYGGWSMDNLGISIDGGYTGTYNDLRQDLPAAMNMAQLKGDVNSDAWHAGLRVEYRFETSILDIIPHAGVRWNGVHMDSYEVKSGGGAVFKVDDSYQSIWTFPVGVSVAKTFGNESGWSFRPQVDAGVIPAAGDVKSTARIRIPGVAGNSDLKVQQVDYATFDGTAGFEVANGQGFSVGVNYNLQLSEHRTGHGVYGTLRYEF